MGEAAGNGAKAAELAGYAKGSAKVTASRLLTKANVQTAINQRVDSDPAIATREQRQRWWTGVMNDPTIHIRARLRASELLGKTQADFVERHEHDVRVTLADLLTGHSG